MRALTWALVLSLGMLTGCGRSIGDGSFEDVTAVAGVEGYGFGTTAAAADYDNDGHTDLLVVKFGGLILYHNEGNGTFRNVTEVPAGTKAPYPGPLSYAPEMNLLYRNLLFQQDPRLHFGLATNAMADVIEARWPGEQTQSLTNVPADRVLRITEPGTSRWAPRS